MRLYGSLKELVKIVFRNPTSGKEVELTAAEQSGTGPIQFTIPDANASSDTIMTLGTSQLVDGQKLFEDARLSPPVGDDLRLQAGAGNVSARTLTLTANDADREISLTGDFSTAGNQDITLTATGATNVTLPTAGTLATLAGAEALTNKTQISVDNLDLDGNTLSSTDLNGDINLSPNGTGTVVVNTDLDVDNLNLNGNTISSTDVNGDVVISPNGTGRLKADGGEVAIKDGGFYLNVASNSTLTADKTITLNLNDGNRTLDLSGNLTKAGSDVLTLTTTGVTNVTFPTGTNTLVDTDTTQTILNKTLTSPTINTNSLYDNQAQIRLAEQTGNGSNYVGFSAPDAVTANQIWKLPDGDGISGQALTTNAAGELGWSSLATAEEGGITITKASSGNKTVSSTQCLWAPYLTISTGHTYTIDSGAEMVSFGTVTVDGTLIVNGTSEIIKSA